MNTMRRKKILLIGLDAWAATIFERLVQEGALPNIQRLMNEGSYNRLAPFWPCATGNNWTSIITGASPAIHNCDFKVWLPGRRLDEPQLGFPSQFCKAEQLWQVASREGLNSVIIDYPQSYPVNADRVVHVGEDGCPDNSVREVFRAWAYATQPRHQRWSEVMSKIELLPASGWKNLSGSEGGFLEARLELKPGERSDRPATDHLYALLERNIGGEFVEVTLFSAEKDYAHPLGTTRLGGWTEWIITDVQTTSGPVEIAFRAKLLRLDPTESDLHLFFTQGYPVNDFTQPAGLSRKLLQACGPYQHVSHVQHSVFFGASDVETHLEEVDYHATWFRTATSYILEHYDWDLVALKWHDTDIFEHLAFHFIDPVHPLHDPSEEAKGWEYFRQVYGLGDKMVGALVERAGEDAIVAVVSDHGQIANTYFPDMNVSLAEAGLCTWFDDGRLDVKRTKVLFTPTGVHVNLKDRYVGGIVEPGEEYETVRRQALNLLKDATHPHTGESAFHLVAYKEDLAFMGLDGPQIGDIVYMVNPIVPDRSYTEAEYEELVMGGMWLTSRGTHGPNLPSQRFSVGGIEGICVLFGPGVRPGARPHTTWTSSVAPTLTRLAGWPTPKDADGSVIREAISELYRS